MNNAEYYGHDGPIQVKTNIFPLLDVWLEAGKELGYQIADPNDFQKEGVENIIKEKKSFSKLNVIRFRASESWST